MLLNARLEARSVGKRDKINGANNASNFRPVPFFGVNCIAARNDSLYAVFFLIGTSTDRQPSSVTTRSSGTMTSIIIVIVILYRNIPSLLKKSRQQKIVPMFTLELIKNALAD